MSVLALTFNCIAALSGQRGLHTLFEWFVANVAEIQLTCRMKRTRQSITIHDGNISFNGSGMQWVGIAIGMGKGKMIVTNQDS